MHWTSTDKKEDIDRFLNIHFRPEVGHYSFVHLVVRRNGYTLKTAGNKEAQMTRGEFLTSLAEGKEPGAGPKRGQTNTKPATYWRKPHISHRKRLRMQRLGYYRTDKENMFNYTQNQDYYITANGFCNSEIRHLRNLSTYHNIVIDIDCHDRNKKFTEEEMKSMGDRIQYFMEEAAKEDCTFALPNTIVNTGRGFQIWWALEPCSVKELGYMWKAVTEHYIETLKKVVDEAGGTCLPVFKVDEASSKKQSGLFRVPGTFNSSTGRKGFFAILSDKPSNLVNLFFQTYHTTGREYVKYKKHKKGSHWEGFGMRREEVLTKLILYRQAKGYTTYGQRDLICLFVCGAYASAGESREETIAAVKRVNRLFDVPVDERELESYMSTCLHKKYKFGNQYMIDMLGLTQEEMEATGLESKKEKDIRERKEERKDLEAEILKLKEQGLSQRKIAAIAGTSQSTVHRVLRCAASAAQKCTEADAKDEANAGTDVNIQADMCPNADVHADTETGLDAEVCPNVDTDAGINMDTGTDTGTCSAEAEAHLPIPAGNLSAAGDGKLDSSNTEIIYSYSTAPPTCSCQVPSRHANGLPGDGSPGGGQGRQRLPVTPSLV